MAVARRRLLPAVVGRRRTCWQPVAIVIVAGLWREPGEWRCSISPWPASRSVLPRLRSLLQRPRRYSQVRDIVEIDPNGADLRRICGAVRRFSTHSRLR
jgi:hypothetical protein